MKREALALIAIFGLIVAACATAESNDDPPEINFGRDICVECGMTIVDARFAAAYRTDDGTEKKFDDIGGLVVHGREAGELNDATIWVADFDTEEWLDATTSHFVPTLAVASPMGHGLLAFGNEARAAAFAADIDGEVIGWGVVMDLPVIDGLVGHHHGEAGTDMHDMNDDEQGG